MTLFLPLILLLIKVLGKHPWNRTETEGNTLLFDDNKSTPAQGQERNLLTLLFDDNKSTPAKGQERNLLTKVFLIRRIS